MCIRDRSKRHLKLPFSEGIKEGKVFHDLRERFAVIFLPVIDVENDSAQQASQQHFEYPEHEQMSANRIPV